MLNTRSADQWMEVDVHRFLASVRSADETDWQDAAAMHAGPLLEGSSAVPGTEHPAWLTATRARLDALALQNLGRLVTAHMARGAWDIAAGRAREMCGLDPTSEVASRCLQRALAAQGQWCAVDAEWSRLTGRLKQVFAVAPSAESVALRAELQSQRATPDLPAPVTDHAPEAGKVFPCGATAGEAEALLWAGQAAERVLAFNHAADLYDRALRVMSRDAISPALRVDVLLRREAVLERLGRRADQLLVIDEAMAIARQQQDPARVAQVSLRRAGVCAYLRRHAQAQAAAELALHIFRDLGDAPGEAEALRELGFMHWHAGQHLQALQRTREALELHRRIGDGTGEASALHNLAEIHRGLGSPGQAGPWFEQAIQQHWAAGNPAGEVLSLFGWSQALKQLGDLRGAASKLHAALALSGQHGDRVMHARVLQARSALHADEGELDLAIDCMSRAIAVDRAIGYAHALGHDLLDLSNLYLQTAQVAQARVAILEALVWFGFNDDADALRLTRARLLALDTQGAAAVLASNGRIGIKSHLALGEGKVYCEFESPLARVPAAQVGAG